VVERGVAEAGHGDRVVRPAGSQSQTLSAGDGEGDAQRARQMRSDRRGLRDHCETGVTEHLVPPAGDRLVPRREQPEQDVAHAVVTGHLLGPGEVEPARPVVQQRRIGRAQRRRDEGIGLVAGRADGVEAVALPAQPAGRVVEMTAGQLGVEEPVQPLDGQ
jgi:hypothetical protein